MFDKIDNLLHNIGLLQQEIDRLGEERELLRERLLAELKTNEVKTYKNDHYAVTYVERKNIDIADKDEAVQWLRKKSLFNFLNLVPEHYELNADFKDRVKKGVLEVPGVKVETDELITVKKIV